MIIIDSLLHTISPYANRWGGPRYHIVELFKFLNKYLWDHQIIRFNKKEKINCCLASEALLSANHTPKYIKYIQIKNEETIYKITDELGYESTFPENTELLIYENDNICFKKIKDIKINDLRVINFESVEEFKNYSLHHHTKLNENFITLNCSKEEIQTAMCEALTSMILVKNCDNKILRILVYDKNNAQEIYLIPIVKIEKLEEKQLTIDIELSNFSYLLTKDRKNSDASRNRCYKSIKNKLAKNYLNKMRDKVFYVKKSKDHIEFELINEKDVDK
jgi:hypothetical protein